MEMPSGWRTRQLATLWLASRRDTREGSGNFLLFSLGVFLTPEGPAFKIPPDRQASLPGDVASCQQHLTPHVQSLPVRTPAANSGVMIRASFFNFHSFANKAIV